jgi:hypothetical protein
LKKIRIYLSDEEADALAALAVKEHRQPHEQAELLIVEKLKELGKLKPDPGSMAGAYKFSINGDTIILPPYINEVTISGWTSPPVYHVDKVSSTMVWITDPDSASAFPMKVTLFGVCDGDQKA